MLSFKPHMRFYRAPTPSSAVETQIGSAVFHFWNRAVDLEFGSSPAVLKPKGHATRSTEFQSSVGPLTWQYEKGYPTDMRLVNVEGTTWAYNKRGKFEIAGGVVWGPGLLDEIVISGIAMVETGRRWAANYSAGR